jgi:GNAT superfamily N-acetyltransferase
LRCDALSASCTSPISTFSYYGLRMRDLSPGWLTDLAVLELSGSTIEDRDDHLVIRTASNPDYHWGNCLFVLDPAAVDDADRWAGVFAHEFPDATWLAVGLARHPTDESRWRALGAEVELDEVLTTTAQPHCSAAPDGYEFRRHDGADWEQSVALDVRENERDGEYEPVGHERFVRARADSRRALSDRQVAAWFGAHADGQLVAQLGIVRCGTTARYQAVGTDADHRRRGLATHLLGLAAAWAADNGCNSWVIVTESTNPAGRVYRSVGFEPDDANAQAYRPPPINTSGFRGA